MSPKSFVRAVLGVGADYECQRRDDGGRQEQKGEQDCQGAFAFAPPPRVKQSAEVSVKPLVPRVAVEASSGGRDNRREIQPHPKLNHSVPLRFRRRARAADAVAEKSSNA